MNEFDEAKLTDFVNQLSVSELKLLKSIVSQQIQQRSPKTNPKLFQELGLIGCLDIDETELSKNYKQVITESLEKKHGYR